MTSTSKPKKPEKVCSVCGQKHYAKGLCRKHYRQKPEVKAKKKEQHRKYRQKPEVKAKKKEQHRKYLQKPEVKAKMREYYRKYRQKPEVKAKMREYQRKYLQKPEVKAKKREYRQKPEVMSRKAIGSMVREYHSLMLLEEPTRLQILRLEALAELLGRDLEEWRTEWQKRNYHELQRSGGRC